MFKTHLIQNKFYTTQCKTGIALLLGDKSANIRASSDDGRKNGECDELMKAMTSSCDTDASEACSVNTRMVEPMATDKSSAKV